MNPSKKNENKEENLEKPFCNISIENLLHVNCQIAKQSSESHESENTSDLRQADEFEVSNDVARSHS